MPRGSWEVAAGNEREAKQMSIQGDALAIGLDAALSVTGVDVVYCRGSTELSLTVIKGRRQSELMAAGQVWTQTQSESSDWLFPVSLLASLTPAEPAIADWIEWNGRKYPLAATDDGKHWRWVDPEETWLRVHTVKGGAV
jgi:hypothetical protein